MSELALGYSDSWGWLRPGEAICYPRFLSSETHRFLAPRFSSSQTHVTCIIVSAAQVLSSETHGALDDSEKRRLRSTDCVLSLDACRPKCIFCIPKCALARHLSVKTRFPHAQITSGSTPAVPYALPVRQKMLSAYACRPKCISACRNVLWHDVCLSKYDFRMRK